MLLDAYLTDIYYFDLHQHKFAIFFFYVFYLILFIVFVTFSLYF